MAKKTQLLDGLFATTTSAFEKFVEDKTETAKKTTTKNKKTTTQKKKTTTQKKKTTTQKKKSASLDFKVNEREKKRSTQYKSVTSDAKVNEREKKRSSYVKDIDTKEQERIYKLKPALLKDDYFIDKYKDADAEDVQKSLMSELSNAKDDSLKRAILKEISIVGDVINFRKRADYGDKRRKYEKNIYNATRNVLNDGKTTYSSLSPAQQRTAKHAENVGKVKFNEIESANKELSRLDFSKMTSRDIERIISSSEADAKSSSYGKSYAAQHKLHFLRQKLDEKKTEEADLQYKADEDFIRRNFGGAGYGFVERSVKNLKSEKNRLVSDVASLSQAISMYNIGRAPKGTDIVSLRTELAQKQKRLDEVNEQLPVLERYEKSTKEKMEEENNRVLYGSIEKSADFSAKSKPDIDFWNSTKNKEGHALYGYINNFTHQNGKSYRDIFSNYDGTLGYSDWDVYKYLSETERGKFNYLYNSGRYAAAQNYLSTLNLELSKRRYEKDSAMWKKYAEEHPVLESVGTVVSAPWTAFTSLGAVAYDAADVARGEEIDPYSGWHRQGNKVDVTRSTVTENIDSDAGKFLYNVSMSIGDNVANMAVGSALGVGASAAGVSKNAVKKIVSGFVSTAMGSTSASASIVNNKERGLSDEVALGLGLAQGITEVLTEKYSIEAIMKEPKTMMLGILRGMAAEGSEELASGVITTSLDYLVTGSDSEISKLIADYKEKGYSDKGAIHMALFMNLGEQALAGAVSGGIMSGTLSRVGGNVREDSNDDGPDVLYQIEDIPGTKMQYVKADRQVITGDNPEQWAKDVKNFIDNDIRNGKDVSFTGADGDVLTITADTSGKARFRNEVMVADGVYRPMTDEEYATKLRAETHIDELSQVSKRNKGKLKNDEKNHPFAKDGWHYRTAYFEDFDGAYYRVTLSVGQNGEINTVYNVGKLKEAQSPRGSKAKQNKSALRASASIDNIPQNAENSNKNLSDFDKVIAMGDNDYAETVRKRTENAENQDDVLNSIESVGSVEKSGITYDDMMSGNITEEVREQKENFEGAVGRAGFKVIYATDRNVPKGTIGYVDFKNREIYISPEHFSKGLLNHELTHVIDRGYDGKYVKSLISFFKEEMSKDWNDAEQAIRDKYEKIAEENPDFTYNERTIQAETLAEMCSRLSTDKYIKNAANMKAGTIRQIAVMFRYMWSKMRYHFGDNSEARKMKIASMKWQMALYRAVNEGEANGNEIVFKAKASSPESKYIIETIKNNISKISDENVFDVKTFSLKPEVVKSKYVLQIFESQGGIANSPVLGKVNLSSSGAKATVFHGFGKEKLSCVSAIKSVIENGEIVGISKNYEGKNENRYVIASKGVIDGKESYIGVIVRTFPKNKKANASFYLHEALIIEADPLFMTASQSSEMTVGESASEDIIPQTSQKYNKNISTDDDMLFAVADDEGSAGQDSGSNVRDASALEEEIGIIDEALEDKSLSRDDRLALIKDKVRLKRQLAEIAGEVKDDKPSKREKVLEEYRETEDVGVLPDRDEIRAAESYDKKKISEYRKEFAEIQEALRNQEDLSADDVEELKMRRDAVVTALNRLSENNSVLSEIEGILDELGVVEEPDHRWVSDIAEELSDKQNIIKYGTYNQNDIERNFRHFFGKHFKKAYEKIIQPLYDSKKRYVEGVNEYAEKLKADVVDELGIKKGSRESAAVMWLGEGKRPLSKKELINIHGKEKANRLIAEAKAEGQSEVFIKYTYEDCKKDFGEETARNIQKATEVFRKMYDELIADVNKTRAELYPNNPDKLVKKRKDYFHHFQEMSKGFEGLRNILNTNIGIDPMLVGTSEHTKPKSKWQAYMQERVGNRTVYDAVEGFIRYLPAAQYSIHIDPNIVNVRGLARELALAKASEYSEHGNPDANGFIAYLQKYANSLAGKTVSYYDRGINDSNFGRTATALVGWLNNKTKASAVLGNINSVLSQVTNMKNVIGKIENQADFIKGAVDALGGLNPDGKISARYKESGFLGERYLDRSFSQFDTKWQKMNPVKWAADVLGFADEIGTRITWNAGYNEAIRKNIANPVQYADNFTRACVAGRGIGEEALVFKSQLGKMFLPFRTEVLNDLRVQQDILFGKDDDGKSVAVGKRIKNIMQLYVASMVINAALAALKSDEFDPIEEAEEGFEDGGIFGALESVLRDYADGTGDPVAFDPIYDIVTGIYQGVNEGESAGGKVGKVMQRTVQNIAGDYVSNNPFSSAAMGIVGIDSDTSDMIFNGKVYSPGGMGMPLASNVLTVFRELRQGDEGSAAAAAVKPFLPLGTQIDRSVKGMYDYHKGYATNEAVYERMAGEDGDLKYLIEKTPGNFAKSLLFGPGAFSVESDAFYNDETRQFTEKEQAEILSKSDYDSRKVTFDEILAGRVYDSEEKKRKTLVAEEFFRDNEDSILYEIYSSGEDAALPYKNMGVSTSFTDSKTKKKYTLKLSAEEAEKITDDVSAIIAKRFDRANESDVFSTMTREEQVKYLDGVKNAEYEFAKISALHDKGKMSDEDFFRFETNYKKAEAERDRVLYVDDVSLYLQFNAADTVGQYVTYSDVSVSKKGYEQLLAWENYSSSREPDDVDRELMRLSYATDSSINVAGNPYGIINYSKNRVEYKISMPDNLTYSLCDEVDRTVRSGLASLFRSVSYINATDEIKKDMVASVKKKLRANLRSSYKTRYKSVRIDDLDRVINMK